MKNKIELGMYEFLVILIISLALIFELGFFVGDTVGKSGEYNKGYLNGYFRCLNDFNITKVYYGTKELSEKDNQKN